MRFFVNKIKFFLPTSYKLFNFFCIIIWCRLNLISIKFFFFQSYNFFKKHFFIMIKSFDSLLFSILIFYFFWGWNMCSKSLKQIWQSITMFCRNENWLVGLWCYRVNSCSQLWEFQIKICQNFSFISILWLIWNVQNWRNFLWEVNIFKCFIFGVYFFV